MYRWEVVRRALALAVTAGLGVGCYWTLRLGYADYLYRQNTPESVARAAELAPGEGRYEARRAAFLDLEGGEPGAAIGALERAVALNPRDSSSWIELGLRAEASGDAGKAERRLLEAARVDRTFEPRWTLANYYFRRGDGDNFWRWARGAAEMAYGDPSPLFALCWRMTPEAGTILERAIPDRAEVLGQYLSFLLGEGRLEASAGAAQGLAERADERQVPILLAYCDRALEKGQAGSAVQIWNLLGRRRLIGHAALAPERGISLTNGDFGVEPLGHGFDWRIPRVFGVSASRTTGPVALRIEFSGEQPESWECLTQLVPVVGGRKYRLGYVYRTANIDPQSGLRWRIVEAGRGIELTREGAHLSSEEWTEGSVEFTTPAESRLVRLELAYQRASGTTRIEGSILLREVKLGMEK